MARMADKVTDKELIDRVKMGEKSAYDLLVLKYQQRIVANPEFIQFCVDAPDALVTIGHHVGKVFWIAFVFLVSKGLGIPVCRIWRGAKWAMHQYHRIVDQERLISILLHEL